MQRIPRVFPILILLLALGSSARAESPDDIANPRAARRSWVADNAHVLNSQTVSRLDDLIVSLERETGDEISVVTVSNLGGLSVEEFANRLFNRWGIGKTNRNNGVLLLAAIDDRKMRIEVGDGLEAKLSDARAGYIIRSVIAPRFKAGDYDGGVLDGTRAIANRLENSFSAPAATKSAPAKIGANSAPAKAKTSPKSKTAPKAKTPVKGAPKAKPPAKVVPFQAPVSSGSPFEVPSSGAVPAGAVATGAPYPTSNGGGWPGGAPLLLLALVGGGGLLGWVALSSRAPKCTRCGTGMELVPEGDEDAFLTEVQQLEEAMGGREWNVWRCPKDGFTTVQPHDKFFSAVSNCPRCRCHTATSQTQRVRTASEFHEGLEQTNHLCHNPRCQYQWMTQRTIPRIMPTPVMTSHSHGHGSGFSSSSSHSHSSSSSSSSSSGGSFGGGSSSGGGASGSW